MHLFLKYIYRKLNKLFIFLIEQKFIEQRSETKFAKYDINRISVKRENKTGVCIKKREGIRARSVSSSRNYVQF